MFPLICQQNLRSMRTKLPLKALLVQPVQRIPRYELLVKVSSVLAELTTPMDFDLCCQIECQFHIWREYDGETKIGQTTVKALYHLDKIKCSFHIA